MAPVVRLRYLSTSEARMALLVLASMGKRTISRKGKGREKAMPAQSWPGSLQSAVVFHNGSKVDWP